MIRRYVVIGIVSLFLGAAFLLWGIYFPPQSSSHDVLSAPEIGGGFTLVASDKKVVTERQWPGKMLLLTFGYRFCPDVCPTNLQNMSAALDLLGKDVDNIQPLFVTVDPERDTPDVLADYISLFHKRFVALTGSSEQIAAAAKLFRVYYRKAKSEDTKLDPTNYSVDHSAFIFLTNDRGVSLKIFRHDSTPQELASGIREVLQKRKI
ncbi:protein SCO1 [Azospirillaceae bacterium]